MNSLKQEFLELFRSRKHRQVKEFCEVFEPTVDFSYLINEEYDEWLEENIGEGSSMEPDPAAELKELCDLLYVIYGYGLQRGWDLDKAFTRVHKSNMSKLDYRGNPIRNEAGKVLKGPNYKKPDLSDLV